MIDFEVDGLVTAAAVSIGLSTRTCLAASSCLTTILFGLGWLFVCFSSVLIGLVLDETELERLGGAAELVIVFGWLEDDLLLIGLRCFVVVLLLLLLLFFSMRFNDPSLEKENNSSSVKYIFIFKIEREITFSLEFRLIFY